MLLSADTSNQRTVAFCIIIAREYPPDRFPSTVSYTVSYTAGLTAKNRTRTSHKPPTTKPTHQEFSRRLPPVVASARTSRRTNGIPETLVSACRERCVQYTCWWTSSRISYSNYARTFIGGMDAHRGNRLHRRKIVQQLF